MVRDDKELYEHIEILSRLYSKQYEIRHLENITIFDHIISSILIILWNFGVHFFGDNGVIWTPIVQLVILLNVIHNMQASVSCFRSIIGNVSFIKSGAYLIKNYPEKVEFHISFDREDLLPTAKKTYMKSKGLFWAGALFFHIVAFGVFVYGALVFFNIT